jgi:DNA-binding YbaB/EbfC family protein
MTINPLDLMKNLQKVQEQIGDFQETLADITVTGSSGGGMVEVDMNGKFEVRAVRISKEAWMPLDGAPNGALEPDIEMVEDLIVAACAAAGEKVRREIQGKAGSMAEQMGIPPGLFGGLAG